MDDFDLLCHRLVNAAEAGRTTSLIVGSALCTSGGHGVMSVGQIIQKGLSKYPELDKYGELARSMTNPAADLGSTYREFMQRLIKSRNRHAADDLIGDAVLNAWHGSTLPSEDGTSLTDVDNWELTDGLSALGTVLVSRPEVFGPIITTNFDPLIEVAVRKAGGVARSIRITADSPGPHDIGQTDAVDVVHVHGFWHDTPTMHTELQLTRARPRLASLLANLVANRDVLVVGYGGWDDIITSALEKVTLDDRASTDVMWCFFDHDPAVWKARHKKLFERVDRLILEGMFQPFSGIDCHKLFPKLDGTASDSAVLETGTNTFRGWIKLDEPLLETAGALLSPDDLLRFYNGSQPDWSIATAPLIPVTNTAESLASAFLSLPPDSATSARVLLAPAGDGKSTILMQVASRVARSTAWDVLIRPHPGVEVHPDDLKSVANATNPTLLVIDQVEDGLDQITSCLDDLQGSRNLHILCASRLVDWRNANGDIDAWARKIDAREIGIRPLTHREASLIVRAWEAVPHGLGALERVTNPADRPAALLQAVGVDRKSSGSLLGALFTLRLDNTFLDAHVADLMRRLERYVISDSHINLLEAFLYVAATELVGIRGLDRRVWADALGVEVSTLRRRVEYRLGKEAATAVAGGVVQVRHRAIAPSVFRVLRRSMYNADLQEIFPELCAATLRVGKLMNVANYSNLVHLAVKLPEILVSLGYSRNHSYDIAEATASACAAAEPDMMVFQTDVGSLIRRRGDPARSVTHYQVAFDRKYRDYRRHYRGFLFDWGVSLRVDEDYSNGLFITAFSLADHGGVQLTAKDASRVLTHLADCVLRGTASNERRQLVVGAAHRLATLLDTSTDDIRTLADAAKSIDARALSDATPELAVKALQSSIEALTAQVQSRNFVGWSGRELRYSDLRSLAEHHSGARI